MTIFQLKFGQDTAQKELERSRKPRTTVLAKNHMFSNRDNNKEFIGHFESNFNEDVLYEKFTHNYNEDSNEKLLIKINRNAQLLPINYIKFIRAENQYSNLILFNGNKILVRKSLSYWEKLLSDKKFVRIHRSTIINSFYLQKVERISNSSYQVQLQNTEEKLTISRRYASKITAIEF